MVMLLQLCISILFSLVACLYIQVTENEKTDDRFGWASLKPKNIKYVLWYLATVLFGASVALMLTRFYKTEAITIAKSTFLIALLSPIALTDLKRMIIPNRLICVGLIVRVLFILPEVFLQEDWLMELAEDATMAVLAFLFCIACYFISRRSFGMGDFKLLIMISLLAGSMVIIYLLFSAFVAFITALYLLIAKKKARKDAIPFAPFIYIGTLAGMLLSGGDLGV